MWFTYTTILHFVTFISANQKQQLRYIDMIITTLLSWPKVRCLNTSIDKCAVDLRFLYLRLRRYVAVCGLTFSLTQLANHKLKRQSESESADTCTPERTYFWCVLRTRNCQRSNLWAHLPYPFPISHFLYASKPARLIAVHLTKLNFSVTMSVIKRNDLIFSRQ